MYTCTSIYKASSLSPALFSYGSFHCISCVVLYSSWSCSYNSCLCTKRKTEERCYKRRKEKVISWPHPQDNPYYIKPKVNNMKFGIRHYAGEVFYDVNGLLGKNRDTFRDDMLKVLKDSRYPEISWSIQILRDSWLCTCLTVGLTLCTTCLRTCHLMRKEGHLDHVPLGWSVGDQPRRKPLSAPSSRCVRVRPCNNRSSEDAQVIISARNILPYL